jgi:hypothetical protein
MTILEASASLFSWFAEHDSFNMDNDFQKIVVVTESPDEDKAAINLGLKKWEEMNMVERSGDYWVLSRKLATMEQNITINSETALIISTFNSKYAELVKDNTYQCDPTNIQEKDIQILLSLCGDLIKS